MTPFQNRLTCRAQPRFILKVIGCGFQILYITGYLIDRFVLLNGTQSNIIAVLGYLTGWYKQYSHFYTVSRTDLNQWAFLSGLIHIFQMLSEKCCYYNYFGNIESVRFFLDRPNKWQYSHICDTNNHSHIYDIKYIIFIHYVFLNNTIFYS